MDSLKKCGLTLNIMMNKSNNKRNNNNNNVSKEIEIDDGNLTFLQY